MKMLTEEAEAFNQRFGSWMEVLNEAVEEGRITTSQARTLLLDIATKVDQPWV